MEFKQADYPSFFKTADRYSIEGQQSYLRWIKIELLILVLATVVSLFPMEEIEKARLFAVLSAIAFTAGIIVTFYIKSSKFEDDWYIGRAIAESIKSLTWKYMTNGEPFVASLSIEMVDEKFTGILKTISNENKSFLKVSYKEDDGINITENMRKIRTASFEDRKNVYLEKRVKDQQNWYRTKSIYNKNKANTLFWLMIIFQVVALAYSIYLIVHPLFFNAVPLATTLAAATLSWLQVKQHQELSQSYAVAARDIDLILAQEPYINTEEKLEVFIADAENAFSREHTMWIARRDVFAYTTN